MRGPTSVKRRGELSHCVQEYRLHHSRFLLSFRETTPVLDASVTPKEIHGRIFILILSQATFSQLERPASVAVARLRRHFKRSRRETPVFLS